MGGWGYAHDRQIKRSTLVRNTRLASNDAPRECPERTRGTGNSTGGGPRPVTRLPCGYGGLSIEGGDGSCVMWASCRQPNTYILQPPSRKADGFADRPGTCPLN